LESVFGASQFIACAANAAAMAAMPISVFLIMWQSLG
jgi:hypothetical protein